MAMTIMKQVDGSFMKIGILSDTHNEREMLKKAVVIFESLNVHHLIHCGDVTNPALLDELSGFIVYCVYGNSDLDRYSLKSKLEQLGQNNRIDSFLDLELGGKRIFVIHGDLKHKITEAINNGLYDFVFHGHTHKVEDEWVGSTRVVNPGALGGRYTGNRSIAVLDTIENKLEWFYLD